MPGLPQRNVQFTNAYSSSTCSAAGSIGIWSKHRDDISFDQLQKFWSELKPESRQKLLRIDKQTLLEQARKNLYCSRCNGLLLEGFSQIVMYGKSLQQEGVVANGRNFRNDGGELVCQDDTQDPSVHPWGGLIATREGILTLLDCFLKANSLVALQNVFNSARVRERERELLYPDACGGGGRGWISQGVANYGRGHGTRETCALHTARLSCDTLVDFWSALGDETRRSLLRMKEEDFIERLMYRFDSKRFCRDCRRNVIREFKELKELKRMRREPRCTSWFCVADTAFQYEVSDDMVLADWHQSFSDTFGTYHHFEWAVGTGEGKSDILEFEDVGMNGSVQVNGLDLGDLNSCYITLRAWKLDGRCTELSVKAHAMKGQACVHRRLVVGDGYVTITKGESIRRFFEHAEEAEEEEDDESMDKDGNEMDGEGVRPQKHAKSPELAREFLLDAATVIFKEQVEKAFREGTARQNAHCIFVCLALKLLEEHIHVACKEILTLEKQTRLLEEEEKEKRDEEERKERRRTKEREKKLRRKERLRGKERQRDDSCEFKQNLLGLEEATKEDSSPSVNEESNNSVSSEDSVSETGDNDLTRPLSPDTQEDQISNGCTTPDSQHDLVSNGCGDVGRRDININININNNINGSSFVTEQSKSSRRKLRFQKDLQGDEYLNMSTPPPPRNITGVNRQYRNNFVKCSNTRINGTKFNCSRMRDPPSYNNCNGGGGEERHVYRDVKSVNVLEYRNRCYTPDGGGSTKSKKVWEPIESRKTSNYTRSNSESDVNKRSSDKESPKAVNSPSPTTISDPVRSGSDNCSSSCLSEGDSSTASSSGGCTQNAESWSTSDSEEGREVENGPGLDEKQQPKVEELLTSTGPPVTVVAQQPQRIVPAVYNQGIHFPIIPAPSAMAYYHQSPSSWSASPGPSPFPQPNHHRYLFTTPLGYSMPVSPAPAPPPPHLCIPYTPLQPLPTSMLNVGQHPVYHPVVNRGPGNGPTVVKNSEEQNDAPVAEKPKAKPKPETQGSKLCSDNSNNNFSLFHFGGPIAAGSGARPRVEADNLSSCSNKDATVEEYSLFAASNGSRFSFF